MWAALSIASRYSQSSSAIPYWERAYSLKFTGNPKVSTRSTFVDVCRCEERRQSQLSPLEGEDIQSSFNSCTVNSVIFIVYYLPRFSHFCVLRWWFCCLKWPPSIVLKWCLVFLSARRLGCALWRKHLCSRSFTQACVIALSALCSLIMNWRCLLRKVSSNSNSHKTTLYIDLLIKMLCPEAHRNLTLYLP